MSNAGRMQIESNQLFRRWGGHYCPSLDKQDVSDLIAIEVQMKRLFGGDEAAEREWMTHHIPALGAAPIQLLLIRQIQDVLAVAKSAGP